MESSTNTPTRSSGVRRWLVLGYGTAAYAVFLASFGYAIGFVTGLVVPRTVDHGIDAPLGQAIVINLVLLSAFAVQHSVMARPAFKRWWTRFVPQPIERSTYVLLASLLLGLLCWQWRTIDGEVWHIGPAWARAAVWILAAIGWGTILASTFMINHFELFGLRQVFAVWRGRPNAQTGFRTTLLYGLVRHPLMLGFLIAFWSAPTMTFGHLLFAVTTTAYILIAVRIEEHDLMASLGEDYRRYRNEVPMFVPHPRRAN